MKPQRIGILYPGAMGISIAASAQNSGHQVYWTSEGRSSATRERAAKFGLYDAGTIAALSAECSILLSVCPPHAAEDVAKQVLACGFNGLYVDANAISPERTIRLGQMLAEAGVSFVDGGIIGEPAWKPNTTCLYLAGLRAADIAACFSAGPLETQVLGATVGRASALKMCFAAYTKGTLALLSAILATAESLGVRDALLQQWRHDDPNFADNVYKRVRAVTAKVHAAAAIVYRRLAQFKDSGTPPTIEDVLGALLQTENQPS